MNSNKYQPGDSVEVCEPSGKPFRGTFIGEVQRGCMSIPVVRLSSGRHYQVSWDELRWVKGYNQH